LEDSNRRPGGGRKYRRKSPPAASLNGNNIVWILTVTFISFLISVILTAASSDVLKEAEIFTAFLVIMVIILVNIIFDTIGTAVTAAEEAPFHAMASRKVYGAKQAIRLIRNADKVSNVCNDVIGDICGIISGAAGAYIIFRLIGDSAKVSATELIVTGMITALTVGGKALGKIMALQNSNYIIYRVGIAIYFLKSKVLFFRRKRNAENGRKKR
jgi:hypothetical protein